MSYKEDAERVLEIRDEIEGLLDEARELLKRHVKFTGNLDAYVFEQIKEHLNKANPYNKDLGDVANAIECHGVDEDEEDEEDEDNI